MSATPPIDPLVAVVGLLAEKVTGLAERVEVAAGLDERTKNLNRLTTRLWKAVAVLGVCVLLALGSVFVSRATIIDSQSAKTRTLCESLNASNAKNAQFWRDLIVKFPSVPPGPDATQSEKDAYALSQERQAQFSVEVDKLGTPARC